MTETLRGRHERAPSFGCCLAKRFQARRRRLQPPNWLHGPATVRPSLNSASACQAECAAFEGCDFFSYEWELTAGGMYHECYLKTEYDDPMCMIDPCKSHDHDSLCV